LFVYLLGSPSANFGTKFCKGNGGGKGLEVTGVRESRGWGSRGGGIP